MGWALIRGWAPINFFLLFVWHPKILHKHCLQFLLGVKMAPRETENNAYSNFWGGFVEQNVASKVKAPTRKDKDKSQRIEDGVKVKPSFFATVLSWLDGGDKPWALDLENLTLKKK